jgi:hypothetical protein
MMRVEYQNCMETVTQNIAISGLDRPILPPPVLELPPDEHA